MKWTGCFKVAIVTAIFCEGIVPAAYAYLDPGTGSFILQTLIAALFGALFVLKSYWLRIKGWFFGNTDTDNNSINNAAENEASVSQKLHSQQAEDDDK